MAKNELTKDERELAEAKEIERKLREDTPLTRAQAKVKKLEAKAVRKEIKKIEKELGKVAGEIEEANKLHDKMVAEGKRIKAEYMGHDRKNLHAKAEVQRVVTKEMRLSSQLKKLGAELERLEGTEGSEQPKEKTLQQAYDEGSSSLWSGGKRKVSKKKGRQKSLKDPYEISEEAD